MTGTQVSPHGQLICDLLRTLARVSSSIRAKRKRSLLDEWVSHLSQWELSDSCYEMSQGESWVAVKDILIFHSVTSTSQRGTPVQLQLNTQGKLVQANDTTASNSAFVLELNPDTFKLKYFEKELMSSLWVTLKLNQCRGGDVSIDKSTDLVALMKALSDGNCFTREPIQFKGQMVVPWLQELPRFTAGQYIVALIENELWIRWIRLRADGTKAATCSTSKVSHLSVSARIESSETKPVILTRVEPNYSNVNIVQTALESFAPNDNDHHKSQNLSSCESQHGVNNKVYDTARKGMAHELVQSFLEIVRSKDHEKLVFIIGTTQKRCINGHNSTQTIKFYKKSLEAAKLWTIIHLLDSQPSRFFSKTTSLSFNTKTSHVSAEPSSSAVSSSGHLKTNININGSRCDIINGSRSSPALKEIARSIVSIPFLESLTPFHELKAIFCTRFLTLGANCFAKQLIEDEDEKDVSEVSAKKSKKKKVKKKKNFAQESHRLGSKGTGETLLTSSSEHFPACAVTSPNSLLNISISPHLLTPHLLERSEACIFIGRWVDELVDTATSLSHKLSPSHTILTPSDIDFSSDNENAPVGVIESESKNTPAALNCQLQGERGGGRERGGGCEPGIEAETEIEIESFLEEKEEKELCFPCPPIDVEYIREEDSDRDIDRDRDVLVAASIQSLGYTDTDTDAVVKSTILTSSSRDSWSNMALFPRLDDYDIEKNIPGNENENEGQEIDSNVNPHSPSLTIEMSEGVRSEEEEESSRGSPGYLRAPSDVFGGWAFDNISGGPHLGPYYSEGQGQGGGQGGGGGCSPYSDGSSSGCGSGSHHDNNMNQSTDSIAFQPFNRFLIFHSNANVPYTPQNSNCNTFAYGSLPPRPYDLQTSNAYRNNNWNNSWNNNWNNIGNDDCYTYKCIYSLDDFADHKHHLMDSKEPCKDSSSSSSKVNSESNSEDDSNGSKSANDGSNNNSNNNNNNNNNMRSSQPAGWNNSQSHVVASTTTCSGDGDSPIAYLAESYSTSIHRSSLRRVGVGVLQGTPQNDIRLAAHVNGCADTPPHFHGGPGHHEYGDQTVDGDSSGYEAEYREGHDCEQQQEQEQEQKQDEEAYDNGNTVSLAASLSHPATVGNLPIVPHGMFTGVHDSVSKGGIPVHASVVNTSLQILCRSPSAVAGNDGGVDKNSLKTLELVAEDVAGDDHKRIEWQEQAYEGLTPPVNELLTASQSEEMLPTKSTLVTEKETATSWADNAEYKGDETASSEHLNIPKGAELGWKMNLLPRQMLVRRSSAPKLSSTTSPSPSQRQGNMKGREIHGTQHGWDIKKQQQQQQAPHTDDGTASHLASTIPGTCVRKPFSSPEHVKYHRPDVLNLHDKGKSAEIHCSLAIITGHDRTEHMAVSPTVSLHLKPDEAVPTVQEACVPCTNDMPPSGQENNAYLVTNEFFPRDDWKIINTSADRTPGNQERGEKAATLTGLGCSATSADASDPLLALALALPRSPPNTVLYTHSSPQTMRVSTSSNKSHSPVVSSPGPPGTPGPLPHTPHSQPMSPSTPLPLSDGNKILTSSPRYAKGESPHSPSCSSRSVIQSPNNDCQGDGRYMKDLLLMSLRCLRSEKERALLLNQQAVQSAVIAGLQHRMFPLPIPLPLPLPTQNLSSRAHLPFAKSLNNEFPPKHSGYTAQNISDEPPHVFNLKRHHTFDSRTERADSDGESGPMMQLNRGFHAMRGGSAYGRGHMGVNPSFPLGYVRGDANAAWEVMSDEGRGTGQFWQASRSRDCDDVYTHHHPAAIGLPYPPRPGSGSGLRPKPFIAKGILGPVPTSDAVPDIEKREFEVQAAVVEVHHERLREGQGQEEGRKTTASAAVDAVLAGAGNFPALQAPAVKEPRPNIPHGRYATSMQHGLSNKKAPHTYTNTTPPVMSAPKSLVEVAQSLGLSADSVQSALSAEILKFVSTVDAQEANLRRVKSDAVDRMRAVVQGLWPRAQVKAFGSFVSGLSLPGSDLDMVICLPNVHTEAAPEAPGGLEGRNSIKESWQQSLARCLSKEEWVAAQSIKVIGNTAIPVVKLKTQVLTPPSFSSQAGSTYYENESRHDHVSDRKKNHVRTSATACTGISSRSHDASASVGPGALSSGVCSSGSGSSGGGSSGSGSGSGIDADSGGGSVLSLDISFEGPGHYGLEANKLTTSLIKAYAPLRPLVLVLKYFLTRKGLCEAFTGGLSSYALLLVTARFLQEVELQEPFDLGALLLGVLNFFGDHFDPRVTGISVARRCYFSRAVQTGPQLYPHLARAPLIPPPSAPPHVHLSVSVPTSHTVSGSGTHGECGLKSDSSVSCTGRDNNSDRARGSGQLLSSDHYSFLNAMTHSQQLVIIPKAADRRHSFQANEHASSNPGRDRGRKYLPSTTAGLQPALSMPSSYSHPNTAHASSGYSSYVPYKFDPLFVEDPLSPGNNVGRNCFRILQVQRSWSEVHSLMSQQIRISARDGSYHSALEILVGKVNISSPIASQGYS